MSFPIHALSSFTMQQRFAHMFASPWFKRLAFLVGVLACLGWLRWGGAAVPRPLASLLSPLTADDMTQPRANTALPVSHGLLIQQTFYPLHDGLSQVEILLARSGEGNGRFRIQLLDDHNTPVFDQTLDTGPLIQGQLYTLRFPPQHQSAGRLYTLQLSGDATNPISVQGYSLNVYQRGQLTLVPGALETEVTPTIAQTLRFVTRYQLSWLSAGRVLAEALYYEGALGLLALFFIPLPGCLVLLLVKQARQWGNGVWWGVAFALGTAVWPLIWYGVTLVNGRFSGWLLWLLFGLGWLVFIGFKFRVSGFKFQVSSFKFRVWGWGTAVRASLLSPHTLLALLLLISLATRLLAVRDILAPPWVDASRHALITAVMVANGQTPSQYAPYLPEVTRFPYHFGFHTLAASLQLMTNWPLPRLLLYLGQLLNGLLPLTVYAAAWLVTRQRRAALLAAFLVAFPFFFPGYYATWGRLTQLTAVFLMPVLLAFTWKLLHGSKQWRKTWPLLGLLAAGLFLVHFRVFLFYLPFVAVAWLVNRGRNGRYLVAAVLLALPLTLPRIADLLQVTNPVGALQYNIPGYNDFPFNYIQVGWETAFWLAAAVGFVLTLLAALRRQRWTAFPLVLCGWGAVTILLLSGHKFGLPTTALVNLNSLYIILFLPLALFLGILVHHIWWDGRAGGVSYVVMGGVLTAVFLFGVRQQITILNPETILVRNADLAGLEWLDNNLPAGAKVAVNSWLWLGNTWAASDGGAWIVPLTRRASSTPPADYGYSLALVLSVSAFNEAATAVTNWSAAHQADWLDQQGYTHIFVGQRGGFFDPAQLAANPHLSIVYGRNGVFIFAIQP